MNDKALLFVLYAMRDARYEAEILVHNIHLEKELFREEEFKKIIGLVSDMAGFLIQLMNYSLNDVAIFVLTNAEKEKCRNLHELLLVNEVAARAESSIDSAYLSIHAFKFFGDEGVKELMEAMKKNVKALS